VETLSDQSENNTAKSYIYNQDFMILTQNNAISASVVVPIVLTFWPAKTIVEFGCARGHWLAIWEKYGLKITGMDGDYVNRDHLLIDPDCFIQGDLSKPQNLGENFDLVQCLEVAEHIAPNAAGQLIETLTAHGDAILFSAARPGQGGEYHINEQPYDYWRDLFAQQGFQLFDCIRPVVKDSQDVQPWYRYNILFFVRQSHIEELPVEIRKQAILPSDSVPDPAPLLYQLRCQFIRLLPRVWIDQIARLKARMNS
jgi:hypothetical protein